MPCYSTGLSTLASLYHVVEATGNDVGGCDDWIAEVYALFVRVGWSMEMIQSVALVSMLTDYTGYVNLFGSVVFWQIGNGQDKKGKPLLVDSVDGLPPVPPPPLPFYYWKILAIPPGTNNLKVRQKVFDAIISFWEQKGWTPIPGLPASITPLEGQHYQLMVAPSWNNTIQTIPTGPAINVNPNGPFGQGGGWIAQSLATPPIKVYFTNGFQGLPHPSMRIGASIPSSPHPFYDDSPTTPGTAVCSGLGPLSGHTQDTIVYLSAAMMIMATQTENNQNDIFTTWAVAATMKALPTDNMPPVIVSRWGSIGSGALSFRAGCCIGSPQQYYIDLNENNVRDTGGAINYFNTLSLTVFAPASQSQAGPIVRWEGTDTDAGPGEICDPWAATNPVGLIGGVVGQLPDAIVIFETIMEPDSIPVFMWDTYKWKIFTAGNTGNFNTAPGTVCLRADVVETPYIPAEAAYMQFPEITIKANVGHQVEYIYTVPPQGYSVAPDDIDPTIPWFQIFCSGTPTTTDTFMLLPPTGAIMEWTPDVEDLTVGTFHFVTKIQGAQILFSSRCSTDPQADEPLGYLQKYRVTVHPAPFFENTTFSPNVFATIRQGYPFELDFPVDGGWTPINFTTSALPDGISTDGDGVSLLSLVGRPFEAGTYDITMRYVDATGDNGARLATSDDGGDVAHSADNVVRIVVTSSTVGWTTASPLPDGKVGTQYGQIMDAVGGQPPYSFSVIAGSFPPGLSIQPSGNVWNFLLFGTPTTAGTYTFTLRAHTTDGQNGDKTFSLVIDP